ncbi:MAG: immunity 53 family protein, partial [Chloroflexota bacterium]|nr:immunity 53 family protein [Chloroflexota bacterium]
MATGLGKAQCDGDWEHSYGVEICTLDNPGWSVKVDLQGTELKAGAFQRNEVHRSEDDWCVTWVAVPPSTRRAARATSAKACTGSARGRQKASDRRADVPLESVGATSWGTASATSGAAADFLIGVTLGR